MATRRVPVQRARYFVVEEIGAETGVGTDAQGRALMATIRLDVKGRWTHGQAQTIPLIVTTDGARELAALLDRTAVAAVELALAGDADAQADAELTEHLAAVTGKSPEEAAELLADPVTGAQALITPDDDAPAL